MYDENLFKKNTIKKEYNSHKIMKNYANTKDLVVNVKKQENTARANEDKKLVIESPVKNQFIEEYKSASNKIIDLKSINSLKEKLNMLEIEKNHLEQDILELRKKAKLQKKEDYSKKILILEQEKEESKKSANHYLNLCSQLAEEVIVLRSKLDNYTHFKK